MWLGLDKACLGHLASEPLIPALGLLQELPHEVGLEIDNVVVARRLQLGLGLVELGAQRLLHVRVRRLLVLADARVLFVGGHALAALLIDGEDLLEQVVVVELARGVVERRAARHAHARALARVNRRLVHGSSASTRLRIRLFHFHSFRHIVVCLFQFSLKSQLTTMPKRYSTSISVLFNLDLHQILDFRFY